MKAFLPAVLSLFAAAALAQEEVAPAAPAPAAPAPASEPAPAESSEDEWHPMTEDEENAAKAVLSAALDESFAAAKEKFGADTNRYFVARGVLADREARTVRLDAFATGIRPGAIAEFLLITLNSGHEYESVFQTFALAADIARAFEFLGVSYVDLAYLDNCHRIFYQHHAFFRNRSGACHLSVLVDRECCVCCDCITIRCYRFL